MKSKKLIELPCEIGQTLYCVSTVYLGRITEEEVIAIVIDSNYDFKIVTNIDAYPADFIGTIIFYTKEDAERTLKELEEETKELKKILGN